MNKYAVSLENNRYIRDIADFAKMEGMMEGEIKRSKQFAVKLLMRNEPIDEIIYLTDLSHEQIKEIKSQLPKS